MIIFFKVEEREIETEAFSENEKQSPLNSLMILRKISSLSSKRPSTCHAPKVVQEYG